MQKPHVFPADWERYSFMPPESAELPDGFMSPIPAISGDSGTPYHEEAPSLSNDVRCYAIRSDGNEVPFHWHEAVEIILLRSGELTIRTPDRETRLGAGDWALVNSGEIHATSCLTGNDALVIQIPDAFLRRYSESGTAMVFRNMPHNEATSVPLDTCAPFPLDSCDPIPLDTCAPVPLDTCAPLLAEFHDLLSREKPPLHREWRLRSLLFDLLFRLHVECSEPRDAREADDRAARTIRKVLDYTMRHSAEPLPIAEIAAVAGFQPKYFCRFFKRHLHRTYHEYLADLRFSRVLRDMRNTDLPIHALLERHGFTNYRLFLRMFRETHGMGPKQYRMRLAPLTQTQTAQ